MGLRYDRDAMVASVARNLADPAYEPSDEELQQLARDAFADVAERNREAQPLLWEQIAVLRAEVKAWLAARAKSTP